MGRLAGFLIVGVLGIAIGCGSSSPAPAGSGSGGSGGKGSTATGGSGGGAAACAPFIAGDGIAAWQAGGVSECATVTLATRMTSTSLDFLEIIGATQSSIGISLVVSALPGPLGGTYACKADAGLAYVQMTYSTGTVQDCTITITNPGIPGGAHATGTFTATVVMGGAAVQVTQGVFDTPVMTTGG